MRMNDMFPSKYLKKEEFPAPAVLTIKVCAMEEVARGEEKPILYFVEKSKGLVLNKTKGIELALHYGDDTDEWAGKKVRLSADPSVRDLSGKIVGGIKLECAKGKGKAAPPPPPPSALVPVDGEDGDDGVF